MTSEQWLIKNIGSNPISVRDLPKIPTVEVNRMIDLLNFYDKEAVARSRALKSLFINGIMSITVRNDDGEFVATGQNAVDAVNQLQKYGDNPVPVVYTITAPGTYALDRNVSICVVDYSGTSDPENLAHVTMCDPLGLETKTVYILVNQVSQNSTAFVKIYQNDGTTLIASRGGAFAPSPYRLVSFGSIWINT